MNLILEKISSSYQPMDDFSKSLLNGKPIENENDLDTARCACEMNNIRLYVYDRKKQTVHRLIRSRKVLIHNLSQVLS